MKKVQITLTPEEEKSLLLKARSLGYGVTKFIKFLVTKEAYSTLNLIPRINLSESEEQQLTQSLNDYKKGNYVEVNLKNKSDLDRILKT